MNGIQAPENVLLGHVLERNRAFVAGRQAHPLPPVEPLDLAVVACYDPRLDPLLGPALGLDAGRSFVFRSAGALVQPAGATMRSLAMAVYMFGVRSILVVGHTSCRMAAFRSAEFIATFRGRGVPREAFGAGDLREWAGAIPSPRRGVEMSVHNILGAAFLPRDLVVGGLVLDDASGALEVVVEPGRTAAPVPATEPEAAVAPLPAPVEGGALAAEVETAPAPGALDPLLREVVGFARVVRSKQRWRLELEQLRQELGRTQHPGLKLRTLEKFVRRAGAESREISEAFERLRGAALAAQRNLESDDVLHLVREGLERP